MIDVSVKNEILYSLQKDFPLTKRPFLEIAKRFSINENEVINIVKEQKDTGIIRQTSAIFDTKRLGYDSSLVAFKVDEKNLEDAIPILNSHPGISHNYERNHEFNVWFTIAISPDSTLGLEKSVELLSNLSKAKEFIVLPTLKLFKIAVKLDTTGKADKKEKVRKKTFKDIKLTNFHKSVIKYAQEDIEITKEPFKNAIDALQCSYDDFFYTLDELKEAGYLRRFASILNHRKAGFNANAMVVWDVDENIADDEGKKAASFSAVSHCYLRPKYPNWPYNLFTMVHGKSKDETDKIVKEIESDIVYNSNRYLYSTREFKKVRIKYFTDDEKMWEKRYQDAIV